MRSQHQSPAPATDQRNKAPSGRSHRRTTSQPVRGPRCPASAGSSCSKLAPGLVIAVRNGWSLVPIQSEGLVLQWSWGTGQRVITTARQVIDRWWLRS